MTSAAFAHFWKQEKFMNLCIYALCIGILEILQYYRVSRIIIPMDVMIIYHLSLGLTVGLDRSHDDQKDDGREPQHFTNNPYVKIQLLVPTSFLSYYKSYIFICMERKVRFLRSSWISSEH